MKKQTLLFIALALGLSSCQRGCQSLDREFQVTDRNYTIVMFSGGDTVYVDSFTGIVNNSEHSDGVYYYNNAGQLVEISGDYVITSNK